MVIASVLYSCTHSSLHSCGNAGSIGVGFNKLMLTVGLNICSILRYSILIYGNQPIRRGCRLGFNESSTADYSY